MFSLFSLLLVHSISKVYVLAITYDVGRQNAGIFVVMVVAPLVHCFDSISVQRPFEVSMMRLKKFVSVNRLVK